jgi:phage tail-like protein
MPPRSARFDPLRPYKFRVRLGQTTVAGVSRVGALARTITPNEMREAGDLLAPRQTPGAVTYDEVVLERGLSVDKTFEEWANAAARVHVDQSVRGFKRTVFIDVYDLDGNPNDRGSQPLLSYKLHRAWVSKYTALPDLDASSDGVGIQSITLRHDGWERVR